MAYGPMGSSIRLLHPKGSFAVHRIMFLTALFCQPIAWSDQQPICINGRLEDWEGVDLVTTDPIGDSSGGPDFVALAMADDDQNLFLKIEASSSFDLSENNNLRLYLDTDLNASTGKSIGGIGAELEWRPGERSGTFYSAGNETFLYHTDITFRGQPTVTSHVFEVSISRTALPDGQTPLFSGSSVRLFVQDGASGDRIPNAGSAATYTFDVGGTPPIEKRTIPRKQIDELRMITHNVLNDRPFSNQWQDRFFRQWISVRPDILHLQEIYSHSTQETEALIQSCLGGTWFSAGHNDCKTISRYPITGSWTIDGNLAVLIDTADAIGTPILCINAHFPCCSNDEGRQEEADAVMAFVREAYQPGGPLTLEEDVPVLIAGDLNLVGLARQLETLVTGDIADNGSFGPDFMPDPDGSHLHNIVSRLTEQRMGYTWRSDNSWFWPGHLDYMIFSDSNLQRSHDFLLDTREMSLDELEGNDLQEQDSSSSDHLLFCVDFRKVCRADLDNSGNIGFDDLIALLTFWGPCQAQCSGDLNNDGTIGFADLVELISSWGSCTN